MEALFGVGRKLRKAYVRQLVCGLTEEDIESTCQFLTDCGPMVSLVLLLRMRPNYAAALDDCEPGAAARPLEIIGRSLDDDDPSDDPARRSTLAVVREAWTACVGEDSPWKEVIELRGIHGCGVRGPASALHKLFASGILTKNGAPLCGVVRPVPVATPESAGHWLEVDHTDQQWSELLDAISRFRQVSPDDRHQLAEEALRLLSEPQLVAALDRYQSFSAYGGWAGWFFPDRKKLEKILYYASLGEGYFDQLGADPISSLGPRSGSRRKICLIDSGVDESHLMLREKICHYERFDQMMQRKEAYASMDNACHGTRMASLICGGEARLCDMGVTDAHVQQKLKKCLGEYKLSEEDQIRTGIAPEASLVVVEALHGEAGNEYDALATIMAALDWAVQNHQRGHEVVSVSVEAKRDRLTPADERGLDIVFGNMKDRGLVPLVAAGNRGQASKCLSREAYVIGAADREGKPSKDNGPEVSLLAPGNDMLVGQPKLARYGGWPIDICSGSSAAVALVSGCVAGLAAEKGGRRASDVIETMMRIAGESGNRLISVPKTRERMARDGL